MNGTSSENTSGSTLLLHGGRIVQPARVAESASVLIKSDRIVRLRKSGGSERPDAELGIDLQGATLLPGFIDAHIHGFPISLDIANTNFGRILGTGTQYAPRSIQVSLRYQY